VDNNVCLRWLVEIDCHEWRISARNLDDRAGEYLVLPVRLKKNIAKLTGTDYQVSGKSFWHAVNMWENDSCEFGVASQLVRSLAVIMEEVVVWRVVKG
jgi:hypothetical protein